MITTKKATQNGTKIYKTLISQGRSETQARRDAEQWVMGNHGIEITLPVLTSSTENILNRAKRNTVSNPIICKSCGARWISGKRFSHSGLCLSCES